MLHPKFVERESLERSIVDHALGVVTVDDLPGFADAGGRRETLAEKLFKPATAPEAFHEERFEDNRLGEFH
jgi:hypothetical protein